MKKLIVSFEIITTKYSLNELSSRIGLQFSSGSFDKGREYRGKLSKQTVWKLFSDIDNTSSLEEHCKNIFDKLSKVNIITFEEVINDSDLVVNIGVLFDSDYSNCSICISKNCLEIMKDYKLNVEISCYPCKTL